MYRCGIPVGNDMFGRCTTTCKTISFLQPSVSNDRTATTLVHACEANTIF
jgi:hypothetical protein